MFLCFIRKRALVSDNGSSKRRCECESPQQRGNTGLNSDKVRVEKEEFSERSILSMVV
jgi:hypothetical protein